MERAFRCLAFRSELFRIFLLVVVLLGLPVAGRSQIQAASGAGAECCGSRYAVAGSVSDTSGGLVPFARVKATCAQVSQDTRADEKGEYQLEVTADRYNSRAETLRVRDDAAQVAPVFTLAIASASSSVTGSAEGMTSSFTATSSKVDTPILEQPFSIDTITHDQMIQHNPQSVAEAIGYTAGCADTVGEWASGGFWESRRRSRDRWDG